MPPTRAKPKSWFEVASAYAKLGWQVIPVHGTKGTGAKSNPIVCTCGDEDCPAPGQHAWMDDGLMCSTSSLDDLAYYSKFPEAQNIAIVIGDQSGIAALVASDDEAAQYVRHHARKLGGCFQTAHFTTDVGYVWLFEHPFRGRKMPARADVAEGVTLILGTEMMMMPTDLRMGVATKERPRTWRLPFPRDGQLPPLPSWVAADAEVATEDEADALDSLEYLYRGQDWKAYDRMAAELRESDGVPQRASSGTSSGRNDTKDSDTTADKAEEAVMHAKDDVVPSQPGAATDHPAGGSAPVEAAGMCMGTALASWPNTSMSRDPLPFGSKPTDDSQGQTGRPLAGPWVRSGTTTLLLGLPKTSGSTTFLLHLTRSIILERDFLGFETHRSPVVYLTSQSPASFRISSTQASMRLGAAAADKLVVYRDHVADRSWRGIMREAVALCQKNKARVLVIDGLDRFVTAGERGPFITAEAILQGLALATNAGLAVVSAMHQLDDRSAPAYYESVVRAADQQLSLLPIPHCDASLRELRAVSRFSDTPEVVSLVFDPVTSNYRATETPEMYPGLHSIQYELTDMLDSRGDGDRRHAPSPTPAAPRTPQTGPREEEPLVPHLKLFARHHADGDPANEGTPHRLDGSDDAPGRFTLRPVHVAATG